MAKESRKRGSAALIACLLLLFLLGGMGFVRAEDISISSSVNSSSMTVAPGGSASVTYTVNSSGLGGLQIDVGGSNLQVLSAVTSDGRSFPSGSAIFSSGQLGSGTVSVTVKVQAPQSGSGTVSFSAEGYGLNEDPNGAGHTSSAKTVVSVSSAPPASETNADTAATPAPETNADTAATPAPTNREVEEATTTTTAPTTSKASEVLPGLTLKLNGQSPAIAFSLASLSDIHAPEGYAKGKVTINGSEIPAFTEKDSLPLIYGRTPSDTTDVYYFINSTDNSIYRFYPAFQAAFADGNAEIFAIDQPAPDKAFSFETVKIGDDITSALTGTIEGKAYTLIKAQPSGGKKDLYILEKREDGSYALLPLNLATLLRTTQKSVTPTPTPTTSVPAAASTKAGGGISWPLIIMIILMLLLIGGAVYYLLRRRKEQQMGEPLLMSENEAHDLPSAGAMPNPEEVPPLRPLEPNNFDDVDRYFASKPESAAASSAASMGVRKSDVPINTFGTADGTANPEGKAPDAFSREEKADGIRRVRLPDPHERR